MAEPYFSENSPTWVK